MQKCACVLLGDDCSSLWLGREWQPKSLVHKLVAPVDEIISSSKPCALLFKYNRFHNTVLEQNEEKIFSLHVVLFVLIVVVFVCWFFFVFW